MTTLDVTDPLSGAALLARIDALAAMSAEPDRLTRVYLSPEHRRAADLIAEWMRAAGMTARLDAVGNVVGRYEGAAAGAPALLLGSHFDTVRDAGKYDGPLGIVTAIACVESLRRLGERLPLAVEVAGFADEEGVRFGATLIGSRALAGTLDAAILESRDAAGTTMAEAMRTFGLDPSAVGAARRRRGEFVGYIELHIEQGPVLERAGLPVGIVTAIAGASRCRVEVVGAAGHAGTVPMAGRRDALAAAAEMIALVERRAAAEPEVVGTVGMIEATPGAVNVIPGRARFSIDLRAPKDEARERAVADILAGIEAIARRRSVEATVRKTHDSPGSTCAPSLVAAIERAVVAEGIAPLRLASGAGHDAMALAPVAEIGMIFVRCAGGVSHNPAERISADDAETGARVMLRLIRDLAAGHSTQSSREQP